MTIREQYQQEFGASAALFERARAVIAGGITHDGRYLRPFPVYIARARGSHKWDVQGREYIDYWMGHGALLLGHGHPAVVKAIQEQAADGLHYGGCHDLEVRWAEMICRIVPCADRVRFTNSGSEATHLAGRLARAWTGRSKIVKLEGHFHGWHDNLLVAVDPPFAVSPSLGVPAELSAHVLTCPQNDLAAVRVLLDRGDVAGVMLEPSGASFGTIPIRPEYLTSLRQLTAERRVALIFDEVVTGFRYAPGGAQEYYGVTPDLAAFGKIVSGGLTAGAVCGTGEILDLIAYTDDAERNRLRRVSHRGTFSASPIVAAAGIACLELVADGKAIAEANRLGAELRQGFNRVIDRHGLPMAAYGDLSSYHVCLDHGGVVASAARFDPLALDPTVLKGAKPELVHAFRIAMLLAGVDTMRETGFTSSAHTGLDVELTIDAFDKALTRLEADRLLG
jgi:glutamate-1-semialdehyde 2,1-aminomutase